MEVKVDMIEFSGALLKQRGTVSLSVCSIFVTRPMQIVHAGRLRWD
jgi:hypothetical protein